MREFRNILLAILTASSCSVVATAQLINIESQRIQSDSLRKAGNAAISFLYQENNNKPLTQFKSNAVFQFKTKSLKDVFLVLGNYQFSKTRDQQLSNAAFLHFRYNRRLNDWLKYEVYTQLQNNQLLSLRSRFISGTGLRFKFANETIFKGYLGISAFYEYEESIEEENRLHRNDARMSNYLVLNFKFPNDKGEFISTSYYQPLVTKFSDFRFSNQSSLVINFTKHFAFTTTFSYFYDEFPPLGVARETISIENGIRFSL